MAWKQSFAKFAAITAAITAMRMVLKNFKERKIRQLASLSGVRREGVQAKAEDELSVGQGEQLLVVTDDPEQEWVLVKRRSAGQGAEVGFVPRNHLTLHPAEGQ